MKLLISCLAKQVKELNLTNALIIHINIHKSAFTKRHYPHKPYHHRTEIHLEKGQGSPYHIRSVENIAVLTKDRLHNLVSRKQNLNE